jgi:hypothetical protein
MFTGMARRWVRDIGRLEQRLTKDTARRRRVTAITRALGAAPK